MTDIELRNIFKYKTFKLSYDDSNVYFELDQVWKNGQLLGKYNVKIVNDMCIMTFDPNPLEPFQNIWVIPTSGQKILLNKLAEKLMSGDTITLTEIQDGEIPDELKEKLDTL